MGFAYTISTDHREEENFCCIGLCRIHVQTGAFICAIFGIFLSLVEAIACLATGQFTVAAFFLFEMTAFSIIILAQRCQRADIYLCYLTFELIAIIATCLFCLALILALSINGMSLCFVQYFPAVTNKRKFHILLFAILLAESSSLGLKVWIYTVVWRAFKFMRNEQKQPPLA